jgi:lipopolysaccharide export system protein LptA
MSRFVHILLLTALTLLGAPALGQEVAISLGQSLRLDGSAIEVSADSLEVDQTTGSSVFSGNVIASQGDMRIEAGHLRLDYSEGTRPGSRRIETLTASGGVIMATPSEAIEGREGVYSISTQTLEMIGDVVLVQGPNMLSGERFVVDLQTGNGRMIGRVRTIIRVD